MAQRLAGTCWPSLKDHARDYQCALQALEKAMNEYHSVLAAMRQGWNGRAYAILTAKAFQLMDDIAKKSAGQLAMLDELNR